MMFQQQKATTKHNKARKRKPQSAAILPSVCDLEEEGAATHRQVSLTNFFGQPVKKIPRVVSPQTPPHSQVKVARTTTTSGISQASSVSRENTSSISSSHSSYPKNNSNKIKQRSKKTEQLYLDFGQASFGKRTECPHCGTLYVDGVAEDYEAHDRVCRDFKEGVSIRLTTALKKSNQGVLCVGTDEYIMEVKSSQTSTLRGKIQEVRNIAEQELGFVPMDNERDGGTSSTSYNYLLYIVQQRIVGLLVTEKIVEAYVAAPTGEGFLSPTACKANLGVHLMWVHGRHRGKGIATKLLDVARERAVFGYTSIPPNRVAFSSPTEAGLGFARSYMDRHNKAPVLVYRYVNTSA
eukprot:scaffold3240_cov187-Amphora_coffeaeformis.AAC.13